MSTRLGPNLLGHLRDVLGRREWHDATDAQVLTAYLVRRDNDAFAAIVRRHGAMVLGVCRRILGDADDADDAFQATFLVLVRKAAAVTPRERLAGWLHSVAQRTALKARTARARRLARGRRAMASRSEITKPNGDQHDLQPIVDQELAALAERYRLPIVLCDLEGKSRKEAASQLGWKEGTLSGRLARGRRLLASRLTRRGVTLGGAGLAAWLTAQAQAAPPSAALLASTVHAAALVTAGQLSAVSKPVAALTREVLQAMLLSKLKTVSLVVAIAALGCGVLLGFAPVAANTEPPADPPTAKDRAPRATNDAAAPLAGRMYFHRAHDLIVYDAKKKQLTDLEHQLDEGHRFNYQDLSARVSPDGRFLAFGQAEEGHPPSKLQIHDLTKNAEPTVVVSMPGKELSSWSWSPDGKRISFSVWGDAADNKYHPYVVDISTQKVTKVKLPAVKSDGPEGYGAVIHAWSPDGLWLIHARGHFHLVDPATNAMRQLTDEPTGFMAETCRFSPDGKKLVFVGVTKEKRHNLSVVDVLLGKTTVLADLAHRWNFAVTWSPDSRRIACSNVEVGDDFKPNGPCHVDVYDAAGKAKPQPLPEAAEAWLTVTDWR
jgi:RNA polymerase sigma factor (sigma-70 family)